MLFTAVLLLGVGMAMGQGDVQCREFIDVMIVVDGSSSVGVSIDNYRNGLTNLVNRMDIDISTANTGVQLGICYFGTGELQVVPLSLDNTQNSVRTAIQDTQFPGGRTSYHQGIACANRNFERSARPGAGRVVVMIVDGNPDSANQLLAETSTNDLKANGVIVSLIAVAQQFVNRADTQQFASASSLFFEVEDFAAFERETNDFFAGICPEEFIETTTTTTTTTTPRPTRFQQPCDNCLIVNGVGYARAEDCFSFYQCILQEDETWLEFLRRMPVGAFWDQTRLTGEAPARSDCPFDPCQGQSNGTVIGGYSNCRARITCQGGISSFIECCPEGTRLAGNGECVQDATCVDECSVSDTTPGTCFLTRDDTDVQRYFVSDGGFSQNMRCSDGTIFNEDICGCIHAEAPVELFDCRNYPEVRLEFGPNGQVIDASRNRYAVNSFSLETFETNPNSGVYAARFNGSSGIRIPNANSDLRDVTMRVVYRSVGNVQNSAVVSDAECDNTLRTMSIIDDTDISRGFVRTQGSASTVDSQRQSGIREVVFQYDGAEVVISNNGQVSRNGAGQMALNIGSRNCDGIKLGFSNDLNSFVGEIYEFELYKCVAEGTQDFVQK